MATTGAPSSNITEQFVREAPDIEAYKLGLMQSAQKLAAPTLPAYQVAGMTDQQVAALQAGQAGIGAFAPYLRSGSTALTTGTNTLGEAADVCAVLTPATSSKLLSKPITLLLNLLPP